LYTYVKAIALARSIGSQWKEVDLSNILVYDIFTTYTKVFLVLNNDVLNQDVNVDMDTLRQQYSNYTGTLTELLVEIGNRTLQTVATLPNTLVKFAKYSDAVRAGYKIKLTIAGQNLPDNYPQSEMKDLKVTRPGYTTSMDLIQDYCLVSVNGYFHWTDAQSQTAYVYNGGETMRKSKLNHLGILSFYDIGHLQKIKLDPDRIIPVDANSHLRDKILFTIDQDLTDKSYFLVMGGYLVFPKEGVFYQSGEKTFTLDINRLPYVERLFESNNYLDLSELQLTELPINPDAYNVDELFSDEVILKYLTMSQSFLVIVDTPHLVTNKIHIRASQLPGMFTSYQDPVYPLIVNDGKIAEYWKTQEDGFWAVNVQDSFLRNYVISEQPVQQLETVTDQLVSSQPFRHSRGFLLEIAGYRNSQ